MIREITLGQYYNTESSIHKLDPRFKLIATFCFILSLFIYTNIYVYSWAFIFMLVFIALSKVPIKHILKGLKPVIAILMITVVFNLFLIKGDVVFSFWKIHITYQGIISAGYMAARLIMLILGSSIMTYTTSPNELTDGIESVLHPFTYIKIPVHEIAMMMSIALRFIPILMEETDKIIKAQLARGADFESGNLIKRAKSLIPIIVPLFVASFRRANDLAMAMEARCYQGGEGRTKMKPLKYKSGDYIAYMLLIIYIVGLFLLGIYQEKINLLFNI